MPTTNKGTTSLRARRRSANPMRDYDSLPNELRDWMSTAILPWRAKSVRQAFDKAIARTGNPIQALEELDALQARLIAKDAKKVWGPTHPQATDRGAATGQ